MGVCARLPAELLGRHVRRHGQPYSVPDAKTNSEPDVEPDAVTVAGTDTGANGSSDSEPYAKPHAHQVPVSLVPADGHGVCEVPRGNVRHRIRPGRMRPWQRIGLVRRV